MAKAKKTTNRNLKFASSPDKKQSTRQIILTLGGSNGDVFKIEELTKSGKRRELSDDEFAVLVGDEEVEDIGTVLEEAYSAGLTDALDHEHDEEKEEQEIRSYVAACADSFCVEFFVASSRADFKPNELGIVQLLTKLLSHGTLQKTAVNGSWRVPSK
jgi:hypothetical protein